jgi:putative transcriptional regulator
MRGNDDRACVPEHHARPRRGQGLSRRHGHRTAYGVHGPETIDVRGIRQKLGLPQQVLAATYGFALPAVRDWEQGRPQPERSARILLKVVEEEPEAVTRALGS